MKNIVLVLPTLPQYRYDFLSQMNKEFKHNGKKLIVVTGTNVGSKDIREIENPSFSVTRCKTVGISFLGYRLEWQKNLFSTVVKNHPEKVIMLYHAGKLNYNLLLLYLYVLKIPYVLWGSGSGDTRSGLSNFQLKLKALFKYIFVKNSTAYITYGERFANQLIKDGYGKSRVFVAQNTIYVENIYKKYSNGTLKRKYDIRRFLFVGALIPQKNLDKALKACVSLKRKNYNFQFDIIGEGVIKNELIELTKRLKIEDIVSIHGAKYGKVLEVFFESAHVFLLPGTGGLALNEAMAYSLPVISTPGDGTAYDLVEEGKNGFLLDHEYELESLSAKMEYFMNIDNESLKEMGRESLNIIKMKATLGNMVDNFVKSIKK